MAFTFFLAEKLGRMVCELDDMPYIEFIRWNRYYANKQAAEEVQARMVGR